MGDPLLTREIMLPRWYVCPFWPENQWSFESMRCWIYLRQLSHVSLPFHLSLCLAYWQANEAHVSWFHGNFHARLCARLDFLLWRFEQKHLLQKWCPPPTGKVMPSNMVFTTPNLLWPSIRWHETLATTTAVSTGRLAHSPLKWKELGDFWKEFLKAG